MRLDASKITPGQVAKVWTKGEPGRLSQLANQKCPNCGAIQNYLNLYFTLPAMRMAFFFFRKVSECPKCKSWLYLRHGDGKDGLVTIFGYLALGAIFFVWAPFTLITEESALAAISTVLLFGSLGIVAHLFYALIVRYKTIHLLEKNAP